MARASILLERIEPPSRADTLEGTPPSGSVSPQLEDGCNIALHPSRHEFSLPPMDGGKDAWLFLAAGFVFEALVWGFPYSFGVFQDYYTTTPPFAGSPNIAVIGTCAMGLMYLLSPLTLGICRVYARQARYAPVAGMLIMCAALVASSFCTTVNGLVATQGVLYAVGGSVAYSPCMLYIDEWFAARKGLAYGIMWAGTGLAGVVLPLLLESLLGRLGYQTTLRLWSGILFACTAPLAWFIKPRIPVSASSASRSRPWDLRFWGLKAFLCYQFCNVVEAMGFFLPTIYLPTFARSALNAGALTSASTILLVNVASVFGTVAMGWLIDRFHVTTCICISTVGCVLGVFCVWGLSTSLATLYAFCILYGLFAGSFVGSWPGVMKEVASIGADEYGYIDPAMVFGWLAAGRGIGNVVSGPLSGVLLSSGSGWKAGGGYGSGYGGLIVFTGVTALVGGTSWIWRRVGFL
ncbi:major facilitator superfamily domain-containing protein [Truncatella angustata]|uniref:Major facilitator superfamily domain-containing protein n=1 Tax=Truncatella angustata TaxID=152316 RepID=A0A9P9A182_9PEZI|nr:major facilitator superfamily domain-containing protein [Truncatella angustata]KAH6657814.1 major facilitator superfamily domain-containing protein [Truncatella angustata]